MAVLVSTTGVLGTVVLNDLGATELVHPVTDRNFSEQFSFSELRMSEDLGSALDSGYISIVNDGVVIGDSTELTSIEADAGEAATNSVFAKYHSLAVYPRIMDVAEPTVAKSKNLLSIDYKKELNDGKKLHPVHNIGIDGLIIDTIYYDGYVDAQNLGTPIVYIDETYTVDLTEAIPAARTVITRHKERNWYMTDDSLCAETKTTDKIYDTFLKQNNEGKRRRDNILAQANESLATAMILTGESPDVPDAAVKLLDLFETYSPGMQAYAVGGKGTIYDDITNDTEFAWLDNVVPDNGSTQALIPAMIGLTIKSFTVDKLKGLK